jgi:threonine dehydratase
MDQKFSKISFLAIQSAKQALSRYLAPSPLLFNAWLSEAYNCEIYLKLENMQPIGSFKIRGATNKILNLSQSDRKRGVICASAGNHAQGVAWGARKLKVNALIVMPKGAPLVKIQNSKNLGAEVLLEGNHYDEAFEVAKKIARKTGKILIHGFNDPEVIAGQGTLGLEIFEKLPEVNYIIGAVGGGGMMAGTALALKELKPKTILIGCQAQGAPSMLNSIRSGRAITLEKVETFADGIAIGRTNESMRKLLAPRINHWLQADDEQIASSILMLMEKAKIIAEGAGALPLAVLDQIRKKIKWKKVVLIIGGGNIDVNVLARVLDRGLIRAGRRIRVNVLISDHPGSLARLTELMGQMGANILQAIHDRSEPFTRIDQTGVSLTLEVRGVNHGKEVMASLKKAVYRMDIIN